MVGQVSRDGLRPRCFTTVCANQFKVWPWTDSSHFSVSVKAKLLLVPEQLTCSPALAWVVSKGFLEEELCELNLRKKKMVGSESGGEGTAGQETHMDERGYLW